ncbi:MAG: rhomboid family intramembrane serine protease [Pseudomonadota bacterium]
MTDTFEIIFTNLSAQKANLITLILTSQNIETRIEKIDTRFSIIVNTCDREKAFLMVHLYYQENTLFRIRQQIAQFEISSFKSYPAFFIMMLLTLIHAAAFFYHAHEQMVLAYGSSSLFVLQGETYRAVTALFLHADTGHLLGNLAGVLIFCAPVISLSGYGTGPFMLLVVGTFGNLINAHFHQTAHLSIGASTAIMGAAGLLAAYQMIYIKKPFRINVLMPVIAGAVLVALFSQGKNTDIWAHVFGFSSGLVCGLLFFPLNKMLLYKHKELIAALITPWIVIFSFLSAS